MVAQHKKLKWQENTKPKQRKPCKYSQSISNTYNQNELTQDRITQIKANTNTKNKNNLKKNKQTNKQKTKKKTKAKTNQKKTKKQKNKKTQTNKQTNNQTNNNNKKNKAKHIKQKATKQI